MPERFQFASRRPPPSSRKKSTAYDGGRPSASPITNIGKGDPGRASGPRAVEVT